MKNGQRRTKNLLIFCGVVSALSLLALVLMMGVHIPSFGMWFYYWQYEANNTYATIGIDPRDLHEVTRHMIDYLRGGADYLQIETVVWGSVRPFFSDIEIRHMVDVRNLSVASIWIRNISALVFAFSFIPFIAFVVKEKKPKQRVKRKRAARRYLFGAWQNIVAGLMAAVFVLAFIISIDWMAAWVVFHLIFFNNDYWILNPTMDLLINITPAEFFTAISIFVGGFFAVGMLLMLVISRIALKRSSRFAKICYLVMAISALGMLQTLDIFNVLGVLRILGIVLACVVGFILLIFGLAFFTKLRYDVIAKKNDFDASFEYTAKTTWFLGLVRVFVQNGQKPTMHIFGKKLDLDKTGEDLQPPAEILISEVNLEAELPKPPKRKGRFKAKWEQLKGYIEYYEEIDEKIGIRAILAVGWLAIKRAVKKIKPKKFRLRGEFGLEEPDQTGMAMAVVSGLQALGLDIVIDGNFEEKALQLDLHTKGGFRMSSLLWIGVRLWFAKPIRRLRKFIKGKIPKNKKSRLRRKDDKNGYRI